MSSKIVISEKELVKILATALLKEGHDTKETLDIVNQSLSLKKKVTRQQIAAYRAWITMKNLESA